MSHSDRAIERRRGRAHQKARENRVKRSRSAFGVNREVRLAKVKARA